MEKFWMSFLLAGFLIGIINLMIEASFILKKLNYEIMDIKTKFLLNTIIAVSVVIIVENVPIIIFKFLAYLPIRKNNGDSKILD